MPASMAGSAIIELLATTTSRNCAVSAGPTRTLTWYVPVRQKHVLSIVKVCGIHATLHAHDGWKIARFTGGFVDDADRRRHVIDDGIGPRLGDVHVEPVIDGHSLVGLLRLHTIHRLVAHRHVMTHAHIWGTDDGMVIDDTTCAGPMVSVTSNAEVRSLRVIDSVSACATIGKHAIPAARNTTARVFHADVDVLH